MSISSVCLNSRRLEQLSSTVKIAQLRLHGCRFLPISYDPAMRRRDLNLQTRQYQLALRLRSAGRMKPSHSIGVLPLIDVHLDPPQSVKERLEWIRMGADGGRCVEEPAGETNAVGCRGAILSRISAFRAEPERTARNSLDIICYTQSYSHD